MAQLHITTCAYLKDANLTQSRFADLLVLVGLLRAQARSRMSDVTHAYRLYGLSYT